MNLLKRIKYVWIIFMFLTFINIVYAREGLSFSTSLNNPDSINNPALYSVGDDLVWNYQLSNLVSGFNTNVCFYLKDVSNNAIYDITNIPILKRANEQHCASPNPDCPITLINYWIGTTNELPDRKREGVIIRYTFVSGDLPLEKDYQLIAQLRDPNVKCSNPNGIIPSTVPIAESVNYFRYIRPTTPTQQERTNPSLNCVSDYSCDYYFVFVPIYWTNQAEFEQKARERAIFFQDISKFRDRKVGFVYVPINYVEINCDFSNFLSDPRSRENHQKIKDCADAYTRSLGINYERAVGFSNSLTGGNAYFSNKVVHAARGGSRHPRTIEYLISIRRLGDAIPLVAHELAHTYHLCDEYGYFEYNMEDTYLRSIGSYCKDKYPPQCLHETTPYDGLSANTCKGNTPTFRDYSGNPLLEGVCEGDVHYSVMGGAVQEECGYDNTGGYEAVG